MRISSLNSTILYGGTKAIYLYEVPIVADFGNFESIITSDNIIGKYVISEFKNVDFMIYVKGE